LSELGQQQKYNFLSEKFPNRTSETIKARPFQREKIFLRTRNDQAFIVSDVQLGKSLLKKPASGHLKVEVDCALFNCEFLFFQIKVPSRVARWYIFKPKFPNLGKFWGVWQWKMLIYFMTILYILRLLGIFCGH
jgi:hypothetical protein